MPPKQQRARTRFKVITPFRSLVLCGENRQEMEDWLGALKNTAGSRPVTDPTATELLNGAHQWIATSHARPTYCNVCRDALYGVTSHGLSCEVCKYKVHKRCSEKAINNCKWTTLASIGKDIIEDQDGNITMPHQWMEGNLPVAAKCAICDKTCGSVLRLQDWRCLWCKVTVHTACRPSMSEKCLLGPAKLSVVPPIALHSIENVKFTGTDEAWDAVRPIGCSPLLVFVNSKSGDNQGIKFLRRFKQLLNPAQVFDLIKGGPGPGLRLFRHFDPFRVLVCSGDGSVGWVLSEIDRLGMQKQCQVGVLPLGTGNDLARVLGWGASCDDDTNLAHLLEKYEKAGTKMLDRWSIMAFHRGIALPCHKILDQSDATLNQSIIHEYEDSVITHISNILHSDQESIVISSAKVLCETVKDLAIRISETSMGTGDQQLGNKCDVLQQKLDQLLHTLDKEESFLSENGDETNADTLRSDCLSSFEQEQEKGVLEKPEKEMTNMKRSKKRRGFEENQAVISRANSLKRAIRQLVEHAEQAIDEQNISKGPNITITTESENFDVTEKRRELDICGIIEENYMESLSVTPTMETMSSGDPSPCSSPTPNVASLSPMPDIRRESQVRPEELLTLPVPDDFADSRRNSSIQGVFSFYSSTFVESDIDELCKQQNHNCESLEATQQETQSDLPPVTVTSTTLETSTPSDDTTIQDAIISPDTDSVPSVDVSPECPESKSISEKKRVGHRGSCTNSIISSDSMVSESFNQVVKNSESEIDSDILDLTKRSEIEEFGHIDSPENSDQCMSDIPNSESIVDDLSSLGQDLISTMLGHEKYDSVREGILDSEQIEKPQKFCSLAKFEGNDIARRSFKRQRNTKINKDGFFKGRPIGPFGSILEKMSLNDQFNEQSPEDLEDDNKSADLLNAPVCRFKVTSSSSPSNDNSPNFPPAISVVVDPPSPSASVKGKHETDFNFHNLSSYFRRFSGTSMEKLSVELPEGSGCSPQATRRISRGSLLKPAEIVSLAATAAKYGGSTMSLRHERSKSIDKTDEVKKLPIINPLVRLPMWPNVSGGLISQALLANADALCAAVSPLMDPDESLMEGYYERCVMNNYFGIGIDAKISLDFHHKREEHPEKCRSRAKNYMWYGVLGSKQWIQQTYKNLDQRVQLECDGQRIPLPSLQGIVVLNIPSFMGGTNFWGGSKEGDLFLAPSFDDRILEVVAVFGSVQMAASRLINLQHHRIAQCQSIQINILGDEGVPIQVDGEAWVQQPGIIRIIHKNRMQMLYRNRALEESLRTWEEKQRSTMAAVTQSSSTLSTSSRTPSQAHIDVKQIALTDEEISVLIGFIDVASTLVKWVKLLIISHPSIEADLYQIASRTSAVLDKIHPGGKILEGPHLRPVVTEVVSTARQLYEESCELLRDKAHNLKLREDLESKLSSSLATMEHELRKCIFDERGNGLVYLQNIQEEPTDKKNRHRGLFWLKFRRSGQNNGGSTPSVREQATLWGTQEVCTWLDNLQLGEYMENFVSHDIRGKELLTLGRRDLKDLNITKVGHVKRILQAIAELNI
ncbi:diacylglycerol kinase eta isoform X2 [Phymastichus coffea]|uniref:diacylglycerol kinase eta isoform X2 n=1 Tax=Phymastichus coffea TaxID=108790 RepID=UPI00273B0CB8|nr:diacylglycerol kinase eta isoform X2 [Phymastichus coffea]